MDDPSLRSLRRADLRTGLGLAAFAVAMLGIALTFPITDSYGGVRNVWYVSPALLPLMVGAGILMLSLMLVHRAVRDLGGDGARDALRLPRLRRVSPRGIRLLAILAGIAGYVYVLLPRVDFVVATALFLLPFVYAFHLDREASVYRNLWAVLATAAAIAAAGAVAPPELREAAVDGTGLAAFVLVAWVNLRAVRRGAGKLGPWWRGLLLSLAAPLILAVVFRYGLLVPMPHEGTVMTAIDAVRYAVLR